LGQNSSSSVYTVQRNYAFVLPSRYVVGVTFCSSIRSSVTSAGNGRSCSMLEQNDVDMLAIGCFCSSVEVLCCRRSATEVVVLPHAMVDPARRLSRILLACVRLVAFVLPSMSFAVVVIRPEACWYLVVFFLRRTARR
jgi:hypothetical protein